ncbi:Phosphopantetheine attachment site [Streptomyces netropsis]|uniref:Acyl carrier protein n=1 Tax=Streptomyces syringium TaxID=76729 RepID=A0ABS4YDC9_9ACTN|nr:acyl carrier protein [Streptomyces syringium]MBP2406811.1 acyl carrier protein [Streptomyces syringium]SPE61930.1 Phosphopantetheine attachment site [Streptomyces netropsis]
MTDDLTSPLPVMAPDAALGILTDREADADPELMRGAALVHLIALVRQGLELDDTEDVPVDVPVDQLGVDSLLALEIGDHVFDATGAVLTVEDVAQRPTLGGLAALIVADLRQQRAT